MVPSFTLLDLQDGKVTIYVYELLRKARSLYHTRNTYVFLVPCVHIIEKGTFLVPKKRAVTTWMSLDLDIGILVHTAFVCEKKVLTCGFALQPHQLEAMSLN